jgi:hypothetical protein
MNTPTRARGLVRPLLLAMLAGCATQEFPVDEDAGKDPFALDVVVMADDAPQPLAFDVPPLGVDRVTPAPDLPVSPDVVAAQDVPFTPADVSTVCELGTVRCGAQCVDLRSNPAHCGRCGLACAAGRACVGGFCDEPCAAPRLMCGGVCTDPSVDPSHCGACGNACPAGAICTAGRCVSRCGAGQLSCGGPCVDPLSNPLHCGACDTPCTNGSSCSAGRCTTPVSMAPVGSPCGRTSDCQPGWICQAAVQGWPGGYCMREGCNRDSECGPTGTCLIGSTQTACFARCVSASDCRGGYSCVRLNSFDPTGLCFPQCSTNVPVVCGEYACNARTELCTGGCTTSQECSLNSVCLAGDCYCTARTNCGPNRRCYTADGYCGCASDSACAPDARCDVSTGECVAR